MPGEVRPELKGFVSRMEYSPSADRRGGEPLEPERVFYSHIIGDLDVATRSFHKMKGLTDAAQLRNARVENAKIEEAIASLEAVGIKTDQFRGNSVESRRNRNKLIIAVGTIQTVEVGEKVEKAELQRAMDYLNQIGVDASKIELPVLPIVIEEQGEQQPREHPGVDRYEKELESRLKMAGENPGAMRRVVESWMQRHADDADKIPPEVIARAQEVLSSVERLVQRQRMTQRAEGSAFGKTPEELAAMGVEERATRKDPIIVELERPIRGHKIPFEYGGMFMGAGMRAERRAVEEGESFSGERVKLLLAPIWSESLRIYNGEVTGETKADLSTLSSIESMLRTRVGEIQKMLADARKGGRPGEAQKLYFASLIPSEVDLGVGDIAEQILKGGFRSLNDGQVARIPEVIALKEMKQILSWHEAQLQLLRALQAMRSYSTGKKIDSISALGEQADRSLLPTSAIIRIWGLEQLENVPEGQTPKEAEAKMVAKHTEDAMRIYSLIAAVSQEWPTFADGGEASFKAKDQIEVGLKRLIWKHLLVRDLVTEGTVPLDAKFVLNRFGQGLNSERLATVEAFVEYLVTEETMDKLAEIKMASSRTSANGLMAELDAGLTQSVSKAKERAKEEMLGETKMKTVPDEELTPREKEIQLGCANAVAMIHVTGLADQLAKFYAWTVPAEKKEEKTKKARDKGKAIWEDNGQPRIPMVKVGGYPACTAASELMNWTAKLEADRDIGLPIGPATLEDALKMGILPPSLAKTFLGYTTLNEAGRVASLWDYWDGQKIPIYRLTQMMAEKLGPNVHGSWLTSLKSSNKLRALLASTEKENLAGMYNNDALLGDISGALYFGLGPASTDERKLSDARVRGVIYAGLLAYNLGLTRQISTVEVQRRLVEMGRSPKYDTELIFFLRKALEDFSAKKSGSLYCEVASGTEGLRVFKSLVNKYYSALFHMNLEQGGFFSSRLQMIPDHFMSLWKSA